MRTLLDVNELYVNASWPGSTIAGELAIQEMSLAVGREDDGSATFTGMIGHPASHPEECQHFQFVLSPAQVSELTDFLLPAR